ncbi:unnamed protein product [Heligmosomoides polygyrus]|uniref:FDX-ACB domain-containing protein n=1 Tax=Heligmosomoides polygyrus TaxID=6339 RepID=A0A183GKN2_HELPZ|nr:unnamed protein product [Heligmosomoides polygyrus]
MSEIIVDFQDEFKPEILVYDEIYNDAMADGNVFLKDSSFLIDLREDSISEKKLEEDMSATLNEIHAQIKVAKTFNVS